MSLDTRIPMATSVVGKVLRFTSFHFLDDVGRIHPASGPSRHVHVDPSKTVSTVLDRAYSGTVLLLRAR